MFEYERIYDGLFTFEHDSSELRLFKQDFLQYGKTNTMICQNHGRGITIDHKKNVKSLSEERKAVTLKYYFGKARQIRGLPQKSVPSKLPNSKQKSYFEFRNFILVPSQFCSGLCVVGANEQHVFRVNYGPIHIFMRKEKRAENEHISPRIETKYLTEFYHCVINNQNMKILQANEVYFILTQNCSLFYFENAKGRSPLIRMSYTHDFYDEDDDEDDDDEPTNEQEYILPNCPPRRFPSERASSELPSTSGFLSGTGSSSSGSKTLSGTSKLSVPSGNLSDTSNLPSNGFPSGTLSHTSNLPVVSETSRTAVKTSSQNVSQQCVTTATAPQTVVQPSTVSSQTVLQPSASSSQTALQPFAGHTQATSLLSAILQQPPEHQQALLSQLQSLLKPPEQITVHAADLNSLYDFYQSNV